MGMVVSSVRVLAAVLCAAGSAVASGDLAVVLDGERAPGRRVRIACVGDSLTEGFHASGPSRSYPALLQGLLGPEYAVLNFGHSGATLSGPQAGYPSKVPYSRTAEYQASMESRPDIVLIMIGSNDAATPVWQVYRQSFGTLYRDLVKAYQNIATNPLVFVMVPPPLYLDNAYGMQQSVINQEFPALIRGVARGSWLPPAVPVFDAFVKACPELEKNSCPYMSGAAASVHSGGWPGHDDGCHPNDEGYLLVARTVQAAIMPLVQLVAGLSSTLPSTAPAAPLAEAAQAAQTFGGDLWAKRRLAPEAVLV